MKEIRIGNIYGATGGSFAGMVYDKSGLCPTINSGGGGNRQPMIVVGVTMFESSAWGGGNIARTTVPQQSGRKKYV